MKKAWIENNTVRDIANGDPAELFHPDIAAHYDTDVPDDVVQGATLVDGVWVNPAPVEPVTPEPTPTEAPKVSPIEFKLLFTSGERIAIKSSTDPVVQDFYELVEDQKIANASDPTRGLIDLGLKSTQDAIAYLVHVGILTQVRADAILAGTVA